jgi:hypothetical protein
MCLPRKKPANAVLLLIQLQIYHVRARRLAVQAGGNVAVRDAAVQRVRNVSTEPVVQPSGLVTEHVVRQIKRVLMESVLVVH